MAVGPLPACLEMDSIPLIWIVAGIVMVLLEFVIPGLVIIFFGVGALVTGLAMLAGLPEGNGIPFLVFSGVSVASLLGLRRQFKKIFIGTAFEGKGDPRADGDDIVGQNAKVISWSDTEAGQGKVELRGTTWNARANATFAPGDQVKVVARQGLHLDVEKT